MGSTQKFYGKYRALVTNNSDPKRMGRVKVKCPQVLGDYESDWCVPCISLLGNNRGIFCIPEVKQAVWIEFEEGDIDKPIWVGGWSTPQNTPFDTYEDGKKNLIIRTKDNTYIVLKNDGEIFLHVHNGAEVSIQKENVVIKGKTVRIDGSLSVKNDVTISGHTEANDISAQKSNINNFATNNLVVTDSINYKGYAIENMFEPKN